MPFEPPPSPMVVAHRGTSGPAPENTRAAIERVIDIGVDMVEVDVQLTKDGVPILMHDERLERTTTGRGLVTDHTWAEIEPLDNGAWRGPEFVGERVPSLAEVLESTRGRMPMNLDFKTSDVAAPGVAVVRDAGLTADVVISGCQVECFEIIAKAASEITTLLNLEDPLAGLDPVEARAVVRRGMNVAAEFGAAGINLHHSLVDAALVASADEVGLDVWVFTVDDVPRFAELIDSGVTAVTTNRPARMLASLGSRASATSEEHDE
jgi:glycerophosphoryl diester phosphodiesterase